MKGFNGASRERDREALSGWY